MNLFNQLHQPHHHHHHHHQHNLLFHRPVRIQFNFFLLILLPLIALRIHVGQACAGFENAIGDVTQDPVVRFGGPLFINCTLDRDHHTENGEIYPINSSMLFLKHKSKLIPNDLIRIVNNRTISYRVHNSSLEDSGTYICYTRLPQRLVFVCMANVTVGFPPWNVTEDNFSCRSYSLQTLSCRWKPKENFVKTTFELYEYESDDYDKFMYEKHFFRCPVQMDNHTCQWTVDTQPPYRISADKLQLKLVSTNIFGSVSNYFNISHYDIIEPAPPLQFRFLKLNSTYVRLEWENPIEFDYDKTMRNRLRFQLQIDRYSPANVDISTETTTLDDLHGEHLELNDLIPHSKYKFSLRCHVFGSVREPIRSKPSSLSLQTPPDIPYICPVFFNSSFETTTTANGDRSITVYWKPVEQQFSNAKRLYYQIEYGQVDSLQSPHPVKKWSNVEISNSSVTFYKFEHLPTDSLFAFKIYSVNELGRADCSSQLLIDDLINQPPKPIDLTVFHLGDGKYELKWKHNRPSQVKHFSIYWCPNLMPRPYPCVGVLEMKRIPKTSFAESSNLTFSYILDGLDEKLEYQFSIAAENGLSSSGLSWASCIIPKRIEKLDKINDFRVDAISPFQMEVKWKLQCSALSEMIKKFEIVYCELKNELSHPCAAPRRLFIDGGDQKRITLSNLESNTYYRVSIRALIDQIASEENSVIERTFVGPPSNPNRLIHFQSFSRNFTLHWITVMQQREKIDYFKVSYGQHKVKFQPTDVCSRTAGLNDYKYECNVKFSQNVQPSTLYQINLFGCVTFSFMGGGHELCSSPSNLTLKTDIEAPGVMRKPYIKIVDKNRVLVEWNAPENRNGDVNYYKLRLFYRPNLEEKYIVEGNSTELNIDCSMYSQPNGEDHSNAQPKLNDFPYVQVAAVNLKNHSELVGPFSDNSIVHLCGNSSPDMDLSWLIGMTVAVAIAVLCVVLLCFLFIRWILKQINYIKKIGIDLPDGLKEPRLNLEDPPPRPSTQLRRNANLLTRANSVYLRDIYCKDSLACPDVEELHENFPQQLLLLDGEIYDQQELDRIDLNACLLNDNESVGAKLDFSPMSGSVGSSLGTQRSEEVQMEEKKPLLVNARDLDINSSGSNDSGVDVRAMKVSRMKSASEKVGAKFNLFDSESVFKTDLLNFKSLSNSVPSIYDAQNKIDRDDYQLNHGLDQASGYSNLKPFVSHYVSPDNLNDYSQRTDTTDNTTTTTTTLTSGFGSRKSSDELEKMGSLTKLIGIDLTNGFRMESENEVAAFDDNFKDNSFAEWPTSNLVCKSLSLLKFDDADDDIHDDKSKTVYSTKQRSRSSSSSASSEQSDILSFLDYPNQLELRGDEEPINDQHADYHINLDPISLFGESTFNFQPESAAVNAKPFADLPQLDTSVNVDRRLFDPLPFKPKSLSSLCSDNVANGSLESSANEAYKSSAEMINRRKLSCDLLGATKNDYFPIDHLKEL